MNTPTINEFYTFLKDSVRFAKQKEKKTQSIQTFGIIDDMVLLNSDSLGQSMSTYHKGYFWSRKWEQLKNNPNAMSWDYPIFAVLEQGFRIINPLPVAKRQQCNSMQWAIAYPYIENQSASKCPFLEKPEIRQLCIDLLNHVIGYLSDIVYADVDGVMTWQNKKVLDLRQVNGLITNYTVKQLETNYFQKQIKANWSKVENNNRVLQLQEIGERSSAGQLIGFFFNWEYCDTCRGVNDYEVEESNCCSVGVVLT